MTQNLLSKTKIKFFISNEWWVGVEVTNTLILPLTSCLSFSINIDDYSGSGQQKNP